MSWDKINKFELQACRKLLMLDVKDAARLIGGHKNPRTWQRYEKGDRNIPDDIDHEIYALIQLRNKMISKLLDKQQNREADGQRFSMKYYSSYEDYSNNFGGENEVCWRVYQSAVSFVFSEGGDVELI